MKKPHKLSFIIPLFLVLFACGLEYGIDYGQPNTMNVSVNGSPEEYSIKKQYATYEILGNTNRISVSADNGQKSISITWDLEGGDKFTIATYTEATINSHISRRESFPTGHDFFYHESGPQLIPPKDLKNLSNELIVDEFEIGDEISSDKFYIKTLKANFRIDCKEKLEPDTVFLTKINLLEAYINISQ